MDGSPWSRRGGGVGVKMKRTERGQVYYVCSYLLEDKRCHYVDATCGPPQKCPEGGMRDRETEKEGGIRDQKRGVTGQVSVCGLVPYMLRASQKTRGGWRPSRRALTLN
jgi:hypothetical protein